MNNAQPAQNLVKWLSQYFIQHFVQRSDFFAQVIPTHWQTLSLHGHDGHIQSSQDGPNIQSRHSRSSQSGCSQNGHTLQKSDHNSVGFLNASPDVKAAYMIAPAAKQLGVDGAIDPSTLANATLTDVVAALETAHSMPQDLCLPVHIDRIDFFQNPALADGTRFITAMLKQQVGQASICEVIPTDAAGTVVEHLQGYRLRILEARPEHSNALELAFPKQSAQQMLQQPMVDRSNVNVSTDSWTSYQSEAAIDPYGILGASAHRNSIADDGSQAQPVYEKRFPVTFKTGCGISRKVNVAQYSRWVGNIRELLLRGIAADLPDLLSGEWDLVTHTVSLRVLGEATTDGTIQARCWFGNVINSTFDTYIEFCKVLPDETLEPLALAAVRAAWVPPVSDGVPSTQLFPTYLQAYLERFATRVPAAIDLKQAPKSTVSPRSTCLTRLNAGATLYRPQTHRYGDLLLSDVFQTTLEDSNRVGNIDDGSYFTWQESMLDRFLYAIAPKYLRVPTAQGEMISLYSRIDFRQEALPFARIQVLLYVQSVSECGAVFQFEFFRERSVHCKEKLHTGQQAVVWADRQPDGTTVATPWPPSIRQALMQRQPTELHDAVNVS